MGRVLAIQKRPTLTALDWESKNKKKSQFLRKKIQLRRNMSDATDSSEKSAQTQEDDGLPRYSDVLRAAKTLKGISHRTQVLTSTTLNEFLGRRLNNGKGGKLEVFMKCENMQKCGSFKSRGAYNAIYNLTPE